MLHHVIRGNVIFLGFNGLYIAVGLLYLSVVSVPERPEAEETALVRGHTDLAHYWAGLVFVAGVGWWLVHYVEVMTSEFAVTSSRLILKVGLISRYTTELLLAKVVSIGVQQGLTGRLLNFGDRDRHRRRTRDLPPRA